jgi:carbonic anhydrase
MIPITQEAHFMRHTSPAAIIIGFSILFLVMVTSGDAFDSFEEGGGPSTPQAAITALLDGNDRYVEGKAIAHNRPAAREGLAAGQAPFAAVIRCADSRVAPEIVFDQALGELFVCAVAGNVPTPEIVASLEYGVAVLGTKLIVIMGHSSCGAVQAAIENRADTSVLPGSLPMLIDQIVAPCAVDIDPDDPETLNAVTVCNANEGISKLMKMSELIKTAVDKGDLKVVAGVQDLKSGRFKLNKGV